MLWITKHYITQIKEKCHDNFSLIARIFSYIFYFFTFLFVLAKFDIYPYNVTNSCITNCHTNLAYVGLFKIVIAQDEAGSLFFKDAG